MEAVVDLLVGVVALVMGDKAGDCPDILIRQMNIFDPVCLKLAISKGLSLAIVVAAAIVKFPQVYLIVKNRSTRGVSLVAQYMELFLYSTPVAYNLNNGYPFTTWGENFFLVIQVLLILAAMLVINGRYVQFILSLLTYAAIIVPAVTGMVPLEYLAIAQGMAIPVQISTRAFQVRAIVLAKETGQLSFITSMMNWLGCIARIFTVLQEHGDPIILGGFCGSLLANTVVVAMFFIYPRSTSAESSADKKKKN